MRMLSLLFVLLTASPAVAAGFDHTYADWDSTLRQTVDAQGRVDYAALDGVTAYRRFIESLASLTAEEVAGWQRDQQVAFWINAYNALTFQTILDADIPTSIRDIKPDPWEQPRWSVAGRKVSLNWIEHTRLRAQLSEARVHFVLVCAARSCPTLPNRAIVPDGLDAQLERAARTFFGDATKNRIDGTSGTVHLSRILDWYGADFVGAEGTPELPGLEGRGAKETAVLRYLAKHVGDADRAVLARGGITVVYNEYDWSLNRR
jgi:hypothetical protein